MRFLYLLVPLMLISSYTNAQLNQTQYVSIDDSRKGFEVVYKLTNSFINRLTPNLPRVLYENSTSEDDLSIVDIVNRTKSIDLFKDWQFYAQEILHTYPLMIGFLLFSILFKLLVPLIGFICSVKSCCITQKFFPYDGKNDKSKRILYSFIMLILLTFVLMLVITLFATNGNSLKSVEKIPKIVKTQVDSFNNLMKKDIKNFVTVGLNVTNDISKSFISIHNQVKQKIINATISNITISLSQFETEFNEVSLQKINYLKELNDQAKAPIVQKWIDSIESLKVLLNKNPQFNELSELLDKKQTFANIMSLDTKIDSFESLLNGGLSKLNAFKENLLVSPSLFEEDLLEDMNNYLNSVNEFIQTINTTSLDALLKLKSMNFSSSQSSAYIQNYLYYYYGILIIASFALLLFILFSFGLLGICCPRARVEYKTSCDRKVAASCLTTGVSLFFLTSSLLMVTCSIFLVSGMLAKQMVCEPLINLDDHQLFKALKSVKEVNATIGKTNFKNLFNECRIVETIAYSKEINKLADVMSNGLLSQALSFMNQTQLLNEIENFYLNSIESFEFDSINFLNSNDVLNLLSSNNSSITQTQEVLDRAVQRLNEIDTLLDQNETLSETQLREPIEQLRELNKEFRLHLNEMDKTLSKIINFFHNKEKLIQDVQVWVKPFSNETNFISYLKDIVLSMRDEIIVPLYGAEINRTIPKLLKTLPSCKGLSSLYDNLTSILCIDYMDNYNAFWLSMWILLLVYCLVAVFSSKLAKLFKKSYSHSEISEENNEAHASVNAKKRYGKNNFNFSADVPLNQISSNGRIRPIDAYSDTKETNNYTFNHNLKQQQHTNLQQSPPPSYKPHQHKL